MLPVRARSNERMVFLSDVLTTAVEGGIGYWSKVSDYRWWSPTLEGGTAEHPEGQANAYVTVYENDADEDGEDGNIVKTIGVEDIARAIGLIKANQFPKGEGINPESRQVILDASTENDAGEIDADLADCIVQVALFNKVVYG